MYQYVSDEELSLLIKALRDTLDDKARDISEGARRTGGKTLLALEELKMIRKNGGKSSWVILGEPN